MQLQRHEGFLNCPLRRGPQKPRVALPGSVRRQWDGHALFVKLVVEPCDRAQSTLSSDVGTSIERLPWASRLRATSTGSKPTSCQMCVLPVPGQPRS